MDRIKVEAITVTRQVDCYQLALVIEIDGDELRRLEAIKGAVAKSHLYPDDAAEVTTQIDAILGHQPA
jgi:hypothetical protein